MVSHRAGIEPDRDAPQRPGRCIVVGHRGASGRAPENTEDSFRLAAAVGVDAVETDVRRTRDGCLVLIHDATVDRTSDGTGRVRDFDLDDLRRLDMGSWFASGFEGERILTLDEGLILFKSLQLQPVLEIKEPETCAEVARSLGRHGLIGECHVVSFHPEAIMGMKDAAPEITTTLILDPQLDIFRQANVPQAVLSAVRNSRAEGVGLFHFVADKDLVAALHREGVAVSVLLVNRLTEIRAAFDLEPDALLTDFPDRARRVMLEKDT